MVSSATLTASDTSLGAREFVEYVSDHLGTEMKRATFPNQTLF